MLFAITLFRPLRWYFSRIPLHLTLQSIEYQNTPINESQETKIYYSIYNGAPYQQWYYSPFCTIFHVTPWWRWPELNRRLNCYPNVSTVSLLFSSYNFLASQIKCVQSSLFSTNNCGNSFSTAIIITTWGTGIDVSSS